MHSEIRTRSYAHMYACSQLWLHTHTYTKLAISQSIVHECTKHLHVDLMASRTPSMNQVERLQDQNPNPQTEHRNTMKVMSAYADLPLRILCWNAL